MNTVNITSQLAGRDRERLRGYQELLDFYQGRQWAGRERYGEKRLTFNYARVMIDKITSYLMSGISFCVEAGEDNPQAMAAAEYAQKALDRVYQENNLEQLDFETETDCAILGDACYKVTWEGEEAAGPGSPASDGSRGRVRVTAPDIQGIYAWWRGDDISRLWKVASSYSLSEEEAETLYGGEFKSQSSKLKTTGQNPNLYAPLPLSNSQVRSVTEVWTERDFELYLDEALFEQKPNPYGFIPFVIFPNLREPKKYWGISDLAALIEPQRELNRAMSQISHILELSGNPVAVLENVEESTDIAVRPGAVWNIPEDAKAYLLDLLQGGGLQLHISYIELLYRTLQDISEAPQAAFGGLDRNISGVAMQIALYPLLQKVLRKRIIRSAVYNRRNRMILRLLERFGGKSEIPLNPPFSHSNFSADNLRLKVAWGQVLPQDMARLVANEQAMVREGIHSRRKAMEEVGVKDSGAEFARWMAEEEEISKLKPQKSKP